MSKKEITVVPDKKQKHAFSFSRWFEKISLWYKNSRTKSPRSERHSNIDISNLNSSIDLLIDDSQSPPELGLSSEESIKKSSNSDSDAKTKQQKLLKEFALLSGIELSPQFVANFRDSVEKQLEKKYLPPPLVREPEPEHTSSIDNIDSENNTTESDAKFSGVAGDDSLSQNLISKPAYDEEAMRLILSELKNINLINLAVVTGAGGAVLAHSNFKSLNKSTFEDVMLRSVKHFQNLGQKSGLGLLEHSVIEFEEGKLIVESLGESTLFIIVDHSAILGLIRKKSKIQIEKLKLILN